MNSALIDQTISFPRYKPSQWWQSLPFAFSEVNVSHGTRPIGFRFSKYIVNIQAKTNGTYITSCGESDNSAGAMMKAIAELIERAALTTWATNHPSARTNTSNGWAAHQSFEAAKANAIYERVERDAVLAQWYRSIPFLEINVDSLPGHILTWSRTELLNSEYPYLRIFLSTEGLGPSVTCLLVNAKGYGVSGHATKESLVDSIESAIAEACRAAHHSIRRSFWKDTLSLKGRSQGVRVQPGAHALYYAYHEPFPHWLFGSQVSWHEAEGFWRSKLKSFQNNELSKFRFQLVLDSPMFVVFATHPECFDLRWGATNELEVLNSEANRRFSVHLTEQTLNREPHIGS